MTQSTLFSKILVANRSEIACRVFTTAKKMGIATAAIYSDADTNALHTKVADEAIAIGGVSAAESYLVIDKVIDACKQCGADAVHPGYGFLSENAEFAERLQREGITFIGPSEGAIKSMGDKITSKKISADAGVNTVPGFMGIIDDAEHCVKIATEIGYPVMIKASAGGGGKGMRIAWDDNEAREGFDRSKSEAKSSFGDDRIFVEKFITNPRHIEIQVLADNHGNCIALGERECSIQRRNQKVVEEAPSPFLDEALRASMSAQAVALSHQVNYSSAGTVEFIVDGDKNFYFLEMNTRLQVEHPVTELVTGVDLVEQMIRVAANEKLSLQQEDVTLNGWAIECRLYAEDPRRGFLPSIGRLSRYRPPETISVDGVLAVRNDTGVQEGGEISMHYDPMIAKLCTWGPTRDQAIKSMSRALDQFDLEGVGNNLPFLSSILSHQRFISGNLSTAFIDDEYPDGFYDAPLPKDKQHLFAAVAATISTIEQSYYRPQDASEIVVNSKASNPLPLTLKIGDITNDVSISKDSHNTFTAEINGQTLQVQTLWQPGQTITSVEANEERLDFKVYLTTGRVTLEHAGFRATATVLPRYFSRLAELMPEKVAEDLSKYLLCPMPGLVVHLHVGEGDTVEPGQPLGVVEAMKMENVLLAEKKGTVVNIPVSIGDSLQVDDIIMEFQPEVSP